MPNKCKHSIKRLYHYKILCTFTLSVTFKSIFTELTENTNTAAYSFE